MEYRSVYITAHDETEARKIGQALVREKLVACVNYFPIKSIYWWKEQVEDTAEFALVAKTRAELMDKVIRRVKELHSYEIPCVVSWRIEEGNPAFLKWIEDSTNAGEK
jgi:periplasmic divalent cation tolerance protein